MPCRFEFDVKADTGSRSDLDAEAAVQLFHVAREAVDNAIRRARATRVTIGLAARTGEGAVALTVADDGVTNSADDVGGLGLRTMAYRARMIGAKLEVRRLTPTGTSVTCTYPLRLRSSTNRANVEEVLEDDE